MRDVPADGETMGEVLMRGNNVMLGYYANPQATAEAFAGGWFHSGDLAVVHPDGYIELRDRMKDIVISGGENISSIEVEKVLADHPGGGRGGSCGGTRRKWGEVPLAYVGPETGCGGHRRGTGGVVPPAPGAFQVPASAWNSAHCRARPRARSGKTSCAAVLAGGRRDNELQAPWCRTWKLRRKGRLQL